MRGSFKRPCIPAQSTLPPKKSRRSPSSSLSSCSLDSSASWNDAQPPHDYIYNPFGTPPSIHNIHSIESIRPPTPFVLASSLSPQPSATRTQPPPETSLLPSLTAPSPIQEYADHLASPPSTPPSRQALSDAEILRTLMQYSQFVDPDHHNQVLSIMRSPVHHSPSISLDSRNTGAPSAVCPRSGLDLALPMSAPITSAAPASSSTDCPVSARPQYHDTSHLIH